MQGYKQDNRHRTSIIQLQRCSLEPNTDCSYLYVCPLLAEDRLDPGGPRAIAAPGLGAARGPPGSGAARLAAYREAGALGGAVLGPALMEELAAVPQVTPALAGGHRQGPNYSQDTVKDLIVSGHADLAPVPAGDPLGAPRPQPLTLHPDTTAATLKE